jgi:hemerythrin-like domain-containing protein
MRATDILMQEHRAIEQVLDALARGAERLQAGGAARPGLFLEAADFVREFADGCHHRKEEDVLFEAMVASGFPRDGGPIGVMLAEHEEGRSLVRALGGAAHRLAAGDAAARSELVGSVGAYVDLLRQHIQKEDQVLYRMAHQVLGAAEQERVGDACDRIDASARSAREKYLALSEALAQEARG